MKVVKVEQRNRLVRTYKDGSTVYADLGWFVVFEGSREALRIGDDEPDLKVGQMVTMAIQGDENE